MWENAGAIRESAEFQINFKPLSPVNAKPQQLSCCDLILFFALSPLFSRLKTVSCWTERLKREEQTATLAKRGKYSQNRRPPDTVICRISFEAYNLEMWATNQLQILAWDLQSSANLLMSRCGEVWVGLVEDI